MKKLTAIALIGFGIYSTFKIQEQNHNPVLISQSQTDKVPQHRGSGR